MNGITNMLKMPVIEFVHDFLEYHSYNPHYKLYEELVDGIKDEFFRTLNQDKIREFVIEGLKCQGITKDNEDGRPVKSYHFEPCIFNEPIKCDFIDKYVIEPYHKLWNEVDEQMKEFIYEVISKIKFFKGGNIHGVHIDYNDVDGSKCLIVDINYELNFDVIVRITRDEWHDKFNCKKFGPEFHCMSAWMRFPYESMKYKVMYQYNDN